MTGPTHNHTQQSPTDESYWIDGCAIEHGRCDTCGAPCDEQGCTRDRTHEVTRNSTDFAAPEPVQSQATNDDRELLRHVIEFAWNHDEITDEQAERLRVVVSRDGT